MVLPRLHWKQVSTVVSTISANDVLLDAIYTLLQATEYDDGTSRTAGVGSAWTVARYEDTGVTEAVYMTPPTGDVDELRVIIAGQNTATKTPTMDYGPYSNTYVWVGINKGSGAFNAWDNALPFTTGNFSGYNAYFSVSGGPIFRIVLLECEEAISIWCLNESGRPAGFIAGCYIDPISVDPSDVEATGRVYSYATSTATPAVRYGNYGSQFLSHAGTAVSSAHHRSFQPGTGTLINVSIWNPLSFGGIANTKSLGGYTIAHSFMMYNVATATEVGYSRSIFYSFGGLFATPVYDSDGGIIYHQITEYAPPSTSYNPHRMDCLLFKA